jgi:hypothetical protein
MVRSLMTSNIYRLAGMSAKRALAKSSRKLLKARRLTFPRTRIRVAEGNVRLETAEGK